MHFRDAKEFKQSIGGGKDPKDLTNGRAKEKIRITEIKINRKILKYDSI